MTDSIESAIEGANWYIVHTYSGYEQNVKEALEERIARHKLQSFFGPIIVPAEEISQTLKSGEVKIKKKTFYPGYLLVNMIMSDQAWRLVKDTPKVSGFLGSTKSAIPVSTEEVKRITQQMTEGVTSVIPLIEYLEGDEVKVVEGPFIDFVGIIEEVNSEKQRLKVLVTIFGREQLVDLDFNQVKKVEVE